MINAKTKKHCPICNSQRIKSSGDYTQCKKCGYVNKKLEIEK